MSGGSMADRLAALPTVSLEELTAEAGLMTRIDRKYALTRSEAESVLAVLDAAVAPGRLPRVLEHGGVRAAPYESIYFDTPELTSFRLAARGRRRRFKIRTRCYLSSATGYLEVKTSGARRTTVKDRIPYAVEEAEQLTPDGREYAESALGPLGFPGLAEELAPVLVSRYDRTTLLLPGTGARATIDTALSWEDATGEVLDRPGLVIVETKSAAQPSELDRLLWSRGLRPDRISKFGTGLAAVRPGLPGNRWSRVLRRHFDLVPGRSIA